MNTLSLLCVIAAPLGAGHKDDDLIVHEWGTFLSMQGSDGITLEGMYHEEHALPEFVHARSQLRLPRANMKGETPVIYFYTSKRQRVEVEVKFPWGLWTQWYPQAALVGPRPAPNGSPPRLQNGLIRWSADIDPSGSAALLPKTRKDSLWNFARKVDAAWVSTVDRTRPEKRREYERFLFYRGLGEAMLPLSLAFSGGGTLSHRGAGSPALQHLFVLRVENGRGAWRYLARLSPGESPSGLLPPPEEGLPLGEFTGRIAEELAGRLVECGLYPKEAQAMVNTWRESYFATPGVRVLFVLPREWTDLFLPLNITPRPRELVRVMVGRLEALTSERERAAEEAVRALASPRAEDRTRAFETLLAQGRYVEPILRRLQKTTADEGVKKLLDRLLLTGFVTGLRSPASPAGSGAGDAVPARAQLASLLREVGLKN